VGPAIIAHRYAGSAAAAMRADHHRLEHIAVAPVRVQGEPATISNAIKFLFLTAPFHPEILSRHCYIGR
jgi:hypothetical protein